MLVSKWFILDQRSQVSFVVNNNATEQSQTEAGPHLSLAAFHDTSPACFHLHPLMLFSLPTLFAFFSSHSVPLTQGVVTASFDTI